MADWKSIALVPPEWREPFISWVQNELVDTRAAIAFQDRYDPEEMWKAQMENYRADRSPTAEEWTSRLAAIPIIRMELENHPIDPTIWRHIAYRKLHWESAFFSSGRDPHEVKDNLSGIEFDADQAGRLGLKVAGKDIADPERRKGGRPRSPQWLDWVAYLAVVSPDIVRQEGADALINKIAEAMALDGLEAPPRSTVQPAAQAVIAILDRKKL